VVALLTAIASRSQAQISPGPLATAHRELEGTLNCTKCHGGRKEAMDAQCVSCHKDIGWLAGQREGFHGALKGATCASCHPEHAGHDFALIKWPEGAPEKFDHSRAGWALEQSHQRVKCAECHAAKFRVSPAAKLAVRRTVQSWVGLDRDCVSCHEDVHRNALGQDCVKCHDAGKWQVTPGFSHDSTAYALTGKHTEVKCDKCHLDPKLGLATDAAGHPVPRYRPLPHDQCSACHADPHAGRLGAVCTDCHSTKGFATFEKQTFNHDRTKYPLRGRHAAVPCAKCHDFRTEEGKRPPFATCTACHSDPHGGTATLAGNVVDCASCHDVAGFSPGRFSVAQHAQTKYPLEGKHQTVPCAQCHRKDLSAPVTRYGSARVVLRPPSGACLACHTDDHGGQLAARPDKGECASCHLVAGWTPSRFDAQSHTKLKVTLAGKHGTVECAACHGAKRAGLKPFPTTVALGKAGFLFHPPETTCTDCHLDPHQGRFARGGERAKPEGCVACHDQQAFRPSTVTFEVHAKYALPLEGAHRAVPCAGCHGEMKGRAPTRSSLVASGTSFVALKLSGSTVCSDCHKTPHGDQFSSRADHGRCDACHGLDGFAPASRFDHNRDTAFSLKGAHEGVACNRCHTPDRTSTVPGRLIYRPLSGKCESCHGERRGT
jgi:hypothetical protein